MKTVLVFGSQGFVGSLLCPQLGMSDFQVYGFDTCWFQTNGIPRNCFKGDIRDIERVRFVLNMIKPDYVINLACISNDPSADLDPEFTKSVNLDAFEPLVVACKEKNVKRFIHASSGSVYGISNAINITEDHELVPLSLYNKYKSMVEPLLLKHLDDNFQGCIIRPGTLCGYAPRQRLDLTVNIFINQAYNNWEIKLFGGKQQRPNLHIRDMCNLYEMLISLSNSKFPNKEIYNCAYANYPIEVITDLVKYHIQAMFPEKDEIKVTTTDTHDKRSYHIDSSKIFNQLGFKPKFGISHAVTELVDAFQYDLIRNPEDSIYYNVKRLQELGYGSKDKD